MNYHVRFDQVEVFQLRRHSSRDVTLHTRTKYQIDSFELGRQTKRRSMKRFHRSDLYREWVVTHGLKVHNESDGTSLIDDIFLSPSPTDKLAMEKSQKAAKHKNPHKWKELRSSMTRLTSNPFMISCYHLHRQLIDLQWTRSRKQTKRERRRGWEGKIFFIIDRGVDLASVPSVR